MVSFNSKLIPQGATIFPTPTIFEESQFYGRTADATFVRQSLDAGSSIAISGKRRIGRSWFLNHLRIVLPRDHYLVFASDELKPDTIIPPLASTFLYLLIYTFYNAIRPYSSDDFSCLSLDIENPPSMFVQAFHKDLAVLHQKLVENRLRAVILIDEAEALYKFQGDPEVVPAIIRQLAASNSYPYIRVIVAGFDLQSPKRTDPALFDAFTHYQLYGIGAKGAYDLVGRKLNKYNVKFEPLKIWNQVVKLTGEEPTLLRLLGQQLVEQARHNKGTIGTIQIAQAVNVFFTMQPVDRGMSYAWMSLGDNQPIHALLTALAHYPTRNIAEQKSLIDSIEKVFYTGQPQETIMTDLRRLRAFGFLRQKEASPHLIFSSDLLRQWVCLNRSNPGL